MKYVAPLHEHVLFFFQKKKKLDLLGSRSRISMRCTLKPTSFFFYALLAAAAVHVIPSPKDVGATSATRPAGAVAPHASTHRSRRIH